MQSAIGSPRIYSMGIRHPSAKRPSFVNRLDMKKEWPIWEVFIRSKNGLEHRHVGSLHAADAEMAMENARDVYTRREEGVSIWVVESVHISASNPENQGEMFEPAKDKVYRHPTFYELPVELKHI